LLGESINLQLEIQSYFLSSF